MSKNVVIVAAKRTPMGSLQGGLSPLSATELGAAAIQGALDASKISPHLIDEVYMGCVLSAGLGQAPARQAAIKSGLGEKTPCTTVNKVCGSGMKATMMAADQIRLGLIDTAITGGMESMSNAPYMLDKARSGYRLGHHSVIDHMFMDGLEDAYDNQSMGVHAQTTAKEYNITREAMDQYAIRSLQSAQNAISQSWFDNEIVPVTITHRKGSQIIAADEQPGKGRPEKIPALRPAFTKDGTITAANASSISDGASALILMSEEKAQQESLKPLAKIIDYTSHAQAPTQFTCAPVGAMKKLLERQHLSTSDIDLVEINEAFAMVPLLAMQELGFTLAQTNIAGGACALGHPLGSSGSRIIITLLYNLLRTGKKRGLASLCIGGGEGTACLIETC